MKIGHLLFASFIFLSCNQNPSKEKTVFVNDTTHIQDTIIFIKDSTMAAAFADSLPSGAYQGMYPCKGCEGLQQTIMFTADKKYRLEEVKWGTSSLPKKTEGIWERKSGMIWMYQPGRTPLKFFFRKDSLFTDSLQYALVKRDLAEMNPSWKEKQKQGIDFIGVGNEPFWSIEIDDEKMVTFKLADWKKPVTADAVSPDFSKDSTIYNLTADKNKLRVIILSQFCSDGMSDMLYQYKVIVNYKGSVYKGCGVLLNNSPGIK